MVNAQRILSAEMEDVNVFLALPWDPITNVTRVSIFFFLLLMQTLNGEKSRCKIYSIELFCCCPIHEIRRRLCFVKLLITKVNANRRHLKPFMHDFNFNSSRKLLSLFFFDEIKSQIFLVNTLTRTENV